MWHPTAANVLLTSGADLRLLIWNVGTGEALIEIAGHPDLIWSVAFNYNGSKVVTTCKDKKVRVIDPRSGAILQVCILSIHITCARVCVCSKATGMMA